MDEVIAFAGGKTSAYEPHAYAASFIRDLAVHAATQLEDARGHLKDLKEDALTHMLLGYVRATYPGATREAHANGHVDIFLSHPSRLGNVLKGEAKVINGNGFTWYSQGLTKLVKKYCSGREGLALLVAYCRRTDMYKVMSDFRERMAKEKIAGFQMHVPTTDPFASTLPRTPFLTSHESSGAALVVVHLWLNLFEQTDKEVLS
jgi:hypothetical protein